MAWIRKKRNFIADEVKDARIPDRKERRFIENLLRVPIQSMRDTTNHLRVGSEKVWASFRSCDLSANILLSTNFMVRGEATGAKAEHPELDRLLSRPNPFDSWEEILYQWVFHMKLTGKAFWVKDQINAAGQPLHFYPLIPQYVRIIPHETNRIKGYEYRVNGKVIVFQPEEIIHFRRPHPSHTIEGLGEIEPSADLYENYIARNELETKFLENGAMPSGILTKKEAVEDEGDWDSLKEWWVTNYEGKRNAGKTAFLNGDWTYQQLGLTQNEMQSIESEKWSVEQIFTNHGVPLSLAGIKDAANYATAKQDEINFRRYSIVPLLDLLIGKLNSEGCLIKAFSPQWELAYELSGLVDVEQTVKEYGPLVDKAALTPNELRELCGLERVNNPLMDQYFVGSSLIPLEMAGFLPTDEPEPEPEPAPPEPPPEER